MSDPDAFEWACPECDVVEVQSEAPYGWYCLMRYGATRNLGGDSELRNGIWFDRESCLFEYVQRIAPVAASVSPKTQGEGTP